MDQFPRLILLPFLLLLPLLYGTLSTYLDKHVLHSYSQVENKKQNSSTLEVSCPQQYLALKTSELES
jgi:hypothetical protein